MIIKKAVIECVKYKVNETQQYIEYKADRFLIVGMCKETGTVITDDEKYTINLCGTDYTVEEVREFSISKLRDLMTEDLTIKENLYR